MRISDWSSDVCSSDLKAQFARRLEAGKAGLLQPQVPVVVVLADEGLRRQRLRRRTAGDRLLQRRRADRRDEKPQDRFGLDALPAPVAVAQRQRSEEHKSELQSLMRISYAGFCLK